MTPLSVIRDHGLQIRAEGDRLHISPRDRLNDELRAYIKQHKPEIIAALTQAKDNRWNPELASKGYVWCLDCKHFDSVSCNHTDNPFHTVEKQPLAPRLCQWYESGIQTNSKIEGK